MKTYSANKRTTKLNTSLHRAFVFAVAFVISNLFFAQKSFGQTATITFDYTGGGTNNCTGETDNTYTGTSGASITVPATGIPGTATITNISFTGRYGVALGTVNNFNFILNGTSIGTFSATTNSCVTANVSNVNISLFNKTGPNTLVVTFSGGLLPGVYNGIFTVTYCTIPTAFSVTGGGAYCSGGTGFAIGLSNSQTNVNYQLFNGASPVGSPVAGSTGSPISFGIQTAAGTYTVTATTAVGGCTNPMTGNATVTVNAIPTASVNVGNKTDLTCFLSANGSITVTGSGGTGPYMYSIDNGVHYYNSNGAIFIAGASYQATGIFNGLPAGAYKIRVKDNNGCESKSVQ